MAHKLAGPDGFHRNTLVLQEAKNSWPIVYVWYGESRHDKGALVRWVFKNISTHQEPVWWDKHSCRPLTYEEWWAFIYYAATKGVDSGNYVTFEKCFYEEVLQPQTAEEKSDG